MTNRKSIFRFKQFECRHQASSMKIGVDAVLVGAWARVEECRRILDVGTGCGVIALMCAQRNPEAIIDAIDIDAPSVAEAYENFRNSPWAARLNALNVSFENLSANSYDLIISNPPFFNSGVENPDSPRLKARHEAELSPANLLSKGKDMLTDRGRIAMILPHDRGEEIIAEARNFNLSLLRLCEIKGHEKAPFKRLLLEFGSYDNRTSNKREETQLILELSAGQPTEEYRELCKQFYLYF
ncbi:MAG: methyltransferase [Muribaculaceae bacterium]|nr:methyltransferase [Muribaculaceae bacterium]